MNIALIVTLGAVVAAVLKARAPELARTPVAVRRAGRARRAQR